MSTEVVKPVDEPKEDQKMQDGAQDAVQVDVHDVLEKFPLPDVVPVLKQHGG